MADMITKDMVINDVIKKYPKTITVFSNFKGRFLLWRWF